MSASTALNVLSILFVILVLPNRTVCNFCFPRRFPSGRHSCPRYFLFSSSFLASSSLSIPCDCSASLPAWSAHQSSLPISAYECIQGGRDPCLPVLGVFLRILGSSLLLPLLVLSTPFTPLPYSSLMVLLVYCSISCLRAGPGNCIGLSSPCVSSSSTPACSSSICVSPSSLLRGQAKEKKALSLSSSFSSSTGRASASSLSLSLSLLLLRAMRHPEVSRRRTSSPAVRYV